MEDRTEQAGNLVVFYRVADLQAGGGPNAEEGPLDVFQKLLGLVRASVVAIMN